VYIAIFLINTVTMLNKNFESINIRYRKRQENGTATYNVDKDTDCFLIPGKLPLASLRDLIIGMKMPPARAEVDGMAGARIASATLRPMAKPRVDFPMA
jgi:hypothetical protein